MRFVNAALVALSLLATLGGYLQEKKRLATILSLAPTDARALYEKAQRRHERVLMLITAVLVAGAVAALLSFKVGTHDGFPHPPAMGSGGQIPPAPDAIKVSGARR